MTAALILGAAIGFTSMLPVIGYLWRGWVRTIRELRDAQRSERFLSMRLGNAGERIDEMRPLAEVGRKRLAALERAKEKGK